MPDQVSHVLSLWRTELGNKLSEKAGQSLADPEKYENLFPGFADALKTQQYLKNERTNLLPAHLAQTVPSNIERNAIEEMTTHESQGNFTYSKEDKPAKNLNEKDDSEDFQDALQVTHQMETMKIQQDSNQAPPNPPSEQSAAATANNTSNNKQRKNSLDDFDFDIGDEELDENIDTSDVNLDDELLSD